MESKKKLFAVYLGGRADRCNIELHDVVFVVGSSIEETYPELKKKWFGNPRKVHIDSYIDLEFADDHKIELIESTNKPENPLKLYFINFGAYLPGVFGECHQSGFYVAENHKEATEKAKKELCLGFEQIHRDDLLEMKPSIFKQEMKEDDVIEIKNIGKYHVFLTQDKGCVSSKPVSCYTFI